MTNKIVHLFLLFIVILVLAGFSIVLTDKQSNLQPAVSTKDSATAETRLVINRHYGSQANTYVGSVMAENPCAILDTAVDLEGDESEKIKLTLATTGGGECENGTAKKDFIIVVPSSESATIEQVVFNGKPIAFEVRQN